MSAIFEFSSGLLVIVVGLAITHVLAGLGSIIRYRGRLEIDWLPIVWMIVMLLVLVGWSYAIWDMLHEIESLEYTRFLVFFLVSVTFYLAARLITPDIGGESNTDLTDAFFETKTAFFLSGAAGFLIIGVYEWSQEGFFHNVSTLEGALDVPLLILLFVGALLGTTKSHWVLISLWTTTYIYQQFIQGALAS
jgi:hypothetical protein